MSTQDTTRQAYYDAIAAQNLAPLWEVLHNLVTPEPATKTMAAIWRYDEIRDAIMQSGDLITAKEAIRRVLILKNPGLAGEAKITNSLFAGLQLILPGEVAPAHRHTQSALRFIVEGSGAYTAVEGEKTIMEPGDFVITPAWTWHDHGNDSSGPMVWLDGLDIPIVNAFEAGFAEESTAERQELTRPSGDTLARFGSGMLPVGYEQVSKSSPVFSYPYSRTREALEKMRQSDEWDPCHGLKLRFTNPVNGDYAMATIGTFMQLLPKGFAGAPHRATDSMVYSVVEGTGQVTIGAETFAWGPRDIFVAPSWQHVELNADEDAVLFSFSDRPVQEKLGFWREDRGNH